MYRITKVLNHNTVLAVKDKSAREYLIDGKGVWKENHTVCRANGRGFTV